MFLRRISLAFRPATARFTSAAENDANQASSTAEKVIAGQPVPFKEILQV
jgi:hypothetical protein